MCGGGSSTYAFPSSSTASFASLFRNLSPVSNQSASLLTNAYSEMGAALAAAGEPPSAGGAAKRSRSGSTALSTVSSRRRATPFDPPFNGMRRAGM